ncbi:MAG: hypothetical protein HQL82_16025 [Magnetococcales bacterium]|nr:hypothetical protein [Magnetococcales bacterium]
MTAEELKSIAAAFQDFRARFGRHLAAKGWTRQDVFGGLDPLAARTWDDLPGVMALVLDGWELTGILPDRLTFTREREKRAWMRHGALVGGKYLEDLKKRRRL